VQLVQQRINQELRVTAILMCMFDSRTSLSTEVKDDIERFLEAARHSRTPWSEAQVIPVHIRRNIKLAEAPSHGQSIFEYEPTCNGAEDYLAVTRLLFPNVSSQPAPTLTAAAEMQGETAAAENTNALSPKTAEQG
jgi:chromosome partitioning protein